MSLPPEDADVAAVREALHAYEYERSDYAEKGIAGGAALDRLAARLQEAEKERDEARAERNGVESDAVSLAAQLAGFKALYEECRDLLAAADPEASK